MTKRQTLTRAIKLLDRSRSHLINAVADAREAAFYGAGNLSPEDVDHLTRIYDALGSMQARLDEERATLPIYPARCHA